MYFANSEPKSELRQLKSLEEWVAIRIVVQTGFQTASDSLEKLDKVITHELRELRPRTVDSDDATYLKGLELCAKIRKGLSNQQFAFIDKIITGKISTLQGSKSVTFSVSDRLSSLHKSMTDLKSNSLLPKEAHPTSPR